MSGLFLVFPTGWLATETTKTHNEHERVEIVGMDTAWVNEAAVNGDLSDLKERHFLFNDEYTGHIALVGCSARVPVPGAPGKFYETQTLFEFAPETA